MTDVLRAAFLVATSLLVAVPVCAKDDSREVVDIVVVIGAAGEDEFGQAFDDWADTWSETCRRAGLSLRKIGPESGEAASSRSELKKTLSDASWKESARPLWLVMIGHGTWDGVSADFNLSGPDVSAREINEWLRSIKRPLVIVNCTSSSGPFINRLSGKDRVIVTATKSGSEQNFARFGEYFAAAFSQIDADLDHDDSISVKEAFLKAAVETQRFYKEQGRLATEHALLDDNGDKRGSSSTLVLGKAATKSGGKVDGELAGRFTLPATTRPIRLTDRQLNERDELEGRLRRLRNELGTQDPDRLREKALPILLELAELYAKAEKDGQKDQ